MIKLTSLAVTLVTLAGCASTQPFSGSGQSGNLTFIRDTGGLNDGGITPVL